MEIEEVRNEVLRKIGRNVILFQQMEQMLKFLIANGNFGGYANELQEVLQQRADTVHKLTLGTAVGQYIDGAYPTSLDENSGGPNELKGIHFSFSFKMETDAAYREKKKEDLASLVAARNELVHHLLPRFNPNSVGSCLETDQLLDRQRESLLPELDELRSMMTALQEGRKEMGEYLLSEAGQKDFQLLLHFSHLAQLLTDLTYRSARKDEWTSVTTASQYIRQMAPDLIPAINDLCGRKSLQILIMEIGGFDLKEEVTAKGGLRVLYRLKDDAVT